MTRKTWPCQRRHQRRSIALPLQWLPTALALPQLLPTPLPQMLPTPLLQMLPTPLPHIPPTPLPHILWLQPRRQP